MINHNGQLPPDAEFDSIIPQTEATAEKLNQPVFDKRNYLDFSIPEGQKTREITIRLLPVSADQKEFFQIVHLHSIPVHKDLKPNKSGHKSYMCLGPKNTGIDHEKYGSKCPICEAQQELWKQWHEESDVNKKKEITKQISALNIREYCIVRCIERGKEADGPKFWRIPLRQDQTDAYHKIVLLGETRHKEGLEAGVNINIYSLYEGRDLIITFTDGTGAPTVVDKGISTPLTRDNDLLVKWYYDEKKWNEVFSTKPYDYLNIAFNGEIPWFDNVNKKWVSKRELDDKNNEAVSNIDKNINTIEEQFTQPISTNIQPNLVNTPPPAYFDNMDDGLPF